MNATTPFIVPPVRKTVRLPVAPAGAFERFARLSAWWPFDGHSIGGVANVAAIELEARQGGRILERWRNGDVHVWGTILLWQPPRLLRFTWHPGRDAQLAQEVELSFTPDGDGTLVQLEHSGWEKLGDQAREKRDNYDNGWGVVFGQHFAAFASRRG